MGKLLLFALGVAAGAAAAIALSARDQLDAPPPASTPEPAAEPAASTPGAPDASPALAG